MKAKIIQFEEALIHLTNGDAFRLAIDDYRVAMGFLNAIHNIREALLKSVKGNTTDKQLKSVVKKLGRMANEDNFYAHCDSILVPMELACGYKMGMDAIKETYDKIFYEQ